MGEIKITIDPMGNSKVSVNGVAGAKCADVTARIEQTLSGQATAITRTLDAEFYNSADTTADTVVEAKW